MRWLCGLLLLGLSVSDCGRTPLRGGETFGNVDSAIADAGEAAVAQNACGGSAPLPAAPNDSCGTCSRWICDGRDALACRPYAPINTCGSCGPTPDEECNGRDDNCDGRVDEGCVRRLTVLHASIAHPRLSGGRVAFDAHGRTTNASDAVMATLPEGVVTFLSPHSDPPGTNADPSQESETTLDGDWVVWITRRVDPLWNGGRVMATNLSTGENVLVSDRRSMHPSVDGASGRVVYESPGTSDYEWDIWTWSASDRVAAPLTGPGADEHEPEISGHRVVFTRGTGTSPLFNRQIVVRDLQTGNEQTLSTGLEGFQTEPAIDGDRVIWRQQTGTTAPSRVGILWLFDLRTGERRRVGTTEVATGPRIEGGLACWSTVTGEPGGLTVIDLSTGRERVLSLEGHDCDVEGRRVVWVEGLSATDVYWRDLLGGEP